MHDVIIIGAGPAGLTAAIYAGRARLKTKVFEKMLPGGQVLLTESVENFPGFPGAVESKTLIDNLVRQVKELDLEIDDAEIKQIKKTSCLITETSEREEFESRSVIIATGAQYKRLDIPQEQKFTGRGVSYCAICDAPLFKNKDVVIIGGGNAAVEEALTVEKFANKVILIHRRDELRAVKVLQEKLLSKKKIQVIWDTIPLEFQGKDRLEAVKIKNLKSNKEDVLSVQGAFVAIGFKPNTDFLKGLIKLDDDGYIITDDEMRTSLDGIFAAGDCRKRSLRQVITSCSEGAICAQSAYKFLEAKF